MRLSQIGCLNISDVVNTKVAKFIIYQSHCGSNHFLSVESIKTEKERGVCHIKLFQRVQLANFNIYIYSILKNCEKYCQSPLFIYQCTSQGIKKAYSQINFTLFLCNSTISNSNWEVPKHFNQGTEEKLNPWNSNMQ